MFKRAIAYLWRQKKRTITLLALLAVLALAALLGVSLSRAVSSESLLLRRFAEASVRLERNEDNPDNWRRTEAPGGVTVAYTGPPITDAEIDAIMRVEGVASYNALGDGSVFARDFSFLSGFDFGPGSDYSRLPSVTDSSLYDYFRRGVYRLSEGRHIGPDDRNVVLVSAALARANNLGIGDFVTVQCCYSDGVYPQTRLKIIGLYESEAEESPFATTSTDKRNRLIVDHEAMRRIMARDEIEYDNGVEFFIEDPERIDDVMDAIRALNLDWDSFALTADTGAWEAMAAPLRLLENTIAGWMIGAATTAFVVLALFLRGWIRERGREIGILLSLGVSKGRILLQFLLEVPLVALVAVGLAYPAASALAQRTGSLLTEQAIAAAPAPAPEAPDDGSELLDITGKYLPYRSSADEAPRTLDVEVEPGELVPVALFVFGFSCASVAAAAFPAARRRPRAILEMNA